MAQGTNPAQVGIMKYLKMLTFQDPDAVLIMVMCHMLIRYPDALERISSALAASMGAAEDLAEGGVVQAKEETHGIIH